MNIAPLTLAQTLATLREGAGYVELPALGLEVDSHNVAYSATETQKTHLSWAIAHGAYERGLAINPVNLDAALRGEAYNLKLLLIEFRELVPELDLATFISGSKSYL